MNDSSNATNQTDRIWESAWPPGLQFAFGVIGNFIALIVLFKSSKRHKWKPFYRLVGGLALTDMCGVLFVYPTVMYRYASDFTYNFPKSLCNYSSFIYSYAILASALIVCAMSLDRFLAILFPFYYNSESKIKRVNIMLGGIWIFTLFICTLHLMGLGDSKLYYPGSWCFLNFVGRTVEDRVNSFIYSILGIIILMVTACLNISVIITVLINIRNSRLTKTTKRRGKNNLYIIVFLLMIVAVFTTCFLPLMINILEHATLRNDENGSTELLVLRFAVTNSIIDPWIYILLRKETLEFIQKVYNRLREKCGMRVDAEKNVSNGAASSTTDSLRVRKLKSLVNIDMLRRADTSTTDKSSDMTYSSSYM
ncbi:hypothetical protein FSP39_006250 [Pinctada imbricata]|uniref:G-protein coupled receptors family 1 profile domain-containing protein n=1 Tax=Pinctada imbricata TaxID=66713 RepID=A0AA89BQ15_PINIB|nr:hypothetical protein FSP39_006250 [Pinctada imbricata]